jgi:hypothetical protein
MDDCSEIQLSATEASMYLYLVVADRNNRTLMLATPDERTPAECDVNVLETSVASQASPSARQANSPAGFCIFLSYLLPHINPLLCFSLPILFLFPIVWPV